MYSSGHPLLTNVSATFAMYVSASALGRSSSSSSHVPTVKYPSSTYSCASWLSNDTVAWGKRRRRSVASPTCEVCHDRPPQHGYSMPPGTLWPRPSAGSRPWEGRRERLIGPAGRAADRLAGGQGRRGHQALLWASPEQCSDASNHERKHDHGKAAIQHDEATLVPTGAWRPRMPDPVVATPVGSPRSEGIVCWHDFIIAGKSADRRLACRGRRREGMIGAQRRAQESSSVPSVEGAPTGSSEAASNPPRSLPPRRGAPEAGIGREVVEDRRDR